MTVSGTASIATGSTLLMYGGSFNTQGDLTVSGTIRGAGTIGGPIGGTGILSAEHGTLDLTGTVASGLTFQIASYGTLKIDGTATTANLAGMIDVNQVLEIGLSGDLTITGSSGYNTAGTVKLDGGTLTDAPTYGTGGQGVFTGFGTMNGSVMGGQYGNAPAIHATGGTLTLNGEMYDGDRPDIAAGATFNLLGAVQLRPPPPGQVSNPVRFNFPLQRQRDAAPRHCDRAAILRDERRHRQYERQHDRRPDECSRPCRCPAR